MKQLRQLLRDHRTLHKISLRKMAKRVGINHSSLQKFEKGLELQEKQYTKLIHWLLTEK